MSLFEPEYVYILQSHRLISGNKSSFSFEGAGFEFHVTTSRHFCGVE